MVDKNGIELKTGDVVVVSGAYFKNDNDTYYIAHGPGDPTWCGKDYSLRKVCKNGKLSKTHKIAFWPLGAFTNDRWKNAVARKHNTEHATIEVINDRVNRSEVATEFSRMSEESAEKARWYGMRFGEEHRDAQLNTLIAGFYAGVADRIKKGE